MTHTFWYSGILIGESDFEDLADDPRRMSGTFRPTAYGEEIFPRLTGVLSAGHALKSLLDAKGLDPDEIPCVLRELTGQTDDVAEKPFDGPRYVVCGTLLDEVPGPSSHRLAGSVPHGRRASDN